MNTTYLATARFPCIFRRTVECIIYCTPAKIVCFGQGIFWLSLLYGAEFVLTDSFHATAFSIIFNKSFYVLKRFSDTSPKSQNSRIYHLLNMTGLEDRIWQNTTNVSYIENDTWKTVDEKMRTERETSTLWLKNALEDK